MRALEATPHTLEASAMHEDQADGLSRMAASAAAGSAVGGDSFNTSPSTSVSNRLASDVTSTTFPTAKVPVPSCVETRYGDGGGGDDMRYDCSAHGQPPRQQQQQRSRSGDSGHSIMGRRLGGDGLAVDAVGSSKLRAPESAVAGVARAGSNERDDDCSNSNRVTPAAKPWSAWKMGVGSISTARRHVKSDGEAALVRAIRVETINNKQNMATTSENVNDLGDGGGSRIGTPLPPPPPPPPLARVRSRVQLVVGNAGSGGGGGARGASPRISGSPLRGVSPRTSYSSSNPLRRQGVSGYGSRNGTPNAASTASGIRDSSDRTSGKLFPRPAAAVAEKNSSSRGGHHRYIPPQASSPPPPPPEPEARSSAQIRKKTLEIPQMPDFSLAARNKRKVTPPEHHAGVEGTGEGTGGRDGSGRSGKSGMASNSSTELAELDTTPFTFKDIVPFTPQDTPEPGSWRTFLSPAPILRDPPPPLGQQYLEEETGEKSSFEDDGEDVGGLHSPGARVGHQHHGGGGKETNGSNNAREASVSVVSVGGGDIFVDRKRSQGAGRQISAGGTGMIRKGSPVMVSIPSKTAETTSSSSALPEAAGRRRAPWAVPKSTESMDSIAREQATAAAIVARTYMTGSGSAQAKTSSRAKLDEAASDPSAWLSKKGGVLESQRGVGIWTARTAARAAAKTAKSEARQKLDAEAGAGARAGLPSETSTAKSGGPRALVIHAANPTPRDEEREEDEETLRSWGEVFPSPLRSGSDVFPSPLGSGSDVFPSPLPAESSSTGQQALRESCTVNGGTPNSGSSSNNRRRRYDAEDGAMKLAAAERHSSPVGFPEPLKSYQDRRSKNQQGRQPAKENSSQETGRALVPVDTVTGVVLEGMDDGSLAREQREQSPASTGRTATPVAAEIAWSKPLSAPSGRGADEEGVTIWGGKDEEGADRIQREAATAGENKDAKAAAVSSQVVSSSRMPISPTARDSSTRIRSPEQEKEAGTVLHISSLISPLPGGGGATSPTFSLADVEKVCAAAAIRVKDPAGISSEGGILPRGVEPAGTEDIGSIRRGVPATPMAAAFTADAGGSAAKVGGGGGARAGALHGGGAMWFHNYPDAMWASRSMNHSTSNTFSNPSPIPQNGISPMMQNISPKLAAGAAQETASTATTPTRESRALTPAEPRSAAPAVPLRTLLRNAASGDPRGAGQSTEFPPEALSRCVPLRCVGSGVELMARVRDFLESERKVG